MRFGNSLHEESARDARVHASAAQGLAQRGSDAVATVSGDAVAAGLVSSKTSPLEILFTEENTRKKRVKRLRRSVWASGHLHGLADQGHRPPVAWMATLTYARIEDWRADHVSAATEQFRRYCTRLGVPCRYLWVAELQKRGAVHYHLIAWLPVGVRMPYWDRPSTAPSGRSVAPFWSHGMTNVERAKTGVGYLMKYLSKVGENVAFPPHLRLYGVGGLNTQARTVRGWYNLPEWAKAEYGVGELRRYGSALVVVETGEIVPPLYRKFTIRGGIRLELLRPRPERFHDGAYSKIEVFQCRQNAAN